jgi:hypothetical protein
MTVLRLGLLAGIMACVALLYAVDPATSHVFPPCPCHALTGLYCPGCGSLRAMHHLLHGEFRAALGLNPLLVVSIPVLCLLAAYPRWAYRPWVSWSAFAVLLTYGVVRNIPMWPFLYLTPNSY